MSEKYPEIHWFNDPPPLQKMRRQYVYLKDYDPVHQENRRLRAMLKEGADELESMERQYHSWYFDKDGNRIKGGRIDDIEEYIKWEDSHE